jgi:protoporphyrin/coproporphyrin ferrochelatase
MSPVDSVLIVAFGGPERPEDIRPFLQIVAAGRPIPPERLEEVAHHYEVMGGRSPLGSLTRRQADALAAALAARDRALPVWVGMRNWRPFLHETLAEMKDRGRRRALGIILSSLQTEASWARYVEDVAAAREKVGPDAPEVVFAPAWAEHPRFVEAMAARARATLDAIAPPRQAAARLVFTAHSVPVAMAAGSPYVTQLEAAARTISARLGRAEWTLAYQSRSGSPPDRWLEPDVGDVIRALAREGVRDVVVVPVGFVCDHVEVLYDLDVEARQAAEAVGVGFHRAAAANDHPEFIAMLADLVGEAAR